MKAHLSDCVVVGLEATDGGQVIQNPLHLLLIHIRIPQGRHQRPRLLRTLRTQIPHLHHLQFHHAPAPLLLFPVCPADHRLPDLPNYLPIGVLGKGLAVLHGFLGGGWEAGIGYSRAGGMLLTLGLVVLQK